ncbi:TadE/TadG family type IV pilus assembly protein [Sphingomonas sp. BGYR3]|uniref:TadE/TadG family type IV pilus assembly protein n=1 Tax=Sphingomonas sp. BGYR3 TaxID=2975483 RepID=UPI0021A64F73|nr:TadE/TadG family type IV pilus assembly protein [Sphingomonas sp. BGYR3]MDG5489338.1 TadE/TadG family type IV pilus assembly protein [Sphingomonas sp. BGYR3]
MNRVRPIHALRSALAGGAGDRRGNALIEFALLLPVLALLLMGMLGYGQYFLLAHNAQQLANDAARASIAGMTASERAMLANESVTTGAASTGGVAADRVSSSITETGTRVTVEVVVDASDVALLQVPVIPFPDRVIRRRAVAHRAGLL